MLKSASKPFPFCSFKPFDYVGREGVLGLEFLVEAILIFQIGFDFLWMFQDEGERSLDLASDPMDG
jgi:hypothetical protein